MDGVDVSKEEAVPLEEIADGVIGLRTIIVNLFALTHGSDWVWSMPVSRDTAIRSDAGRMRT